MIILLVPLQALMDINFSRPCSLKWNFWISHLAFVVPPVFVFTALFTIFLCLKCSQQQQNASSESENMSYCSIVMISFISPYIWVSLLLLDGDYLACLNTDWDGQYACYNELHTKCLNWTMLHGTQPEYKKQKQPKSSPDVPQKMAQLLNLIKKIPEFLKRFPFLVTLPSGFSVIKVEKIVEINFSCPCAVDANANLTISMFAGPSFFIFALLFFFYRPLKLPWSCCSPGANNDTQQNCAKAFIYCLIPPIMWLIVLFLDGDYFSCAKTHWNGVYVFDEQLNRSWCKPIEKTEKENELRLLTQKYIHESQGGDEQQV
ncbi:Calcium homeostasis modulator protein 5 [Labeo rohita]|uniref:Calcium homeostasis modulator protein 5 n=1 Tax=Labeo rohita TaxID=84645 RepID=A0ABQ8LII3_LABRO|nr:Calcium homeostasis modulator protein 5 [Labeo rohita]